MISAMDVDPTLGLYSQTAANRAFWHRPRCSRGYPTLFRVAGR